MSREAAEEFARLADVVAELRQDVAAALAKTTPDHRRDFAQLLTTLKEIQEKPALAASSGDVAEAAKTGATEGSGEAVVDLNKAREALAQAVEEIQAGEKKHRRISRRAKVAMVGLLVLVPALVSFGAGLAVAPTLQREGWLPLTGVPVELTSVVGWALQFKDYDKRALAEWAVSEDGKWAKRFAEENAFFRKGECPDKATAQSKVSCRVWLVR